MEVRRVVRCGCGRWFCLGEGVGHRLSHHHQSLKYREDIHFTILKYFQFLFHDSSKP